MGTSQISLESLGRLVLALIIALVLISFPATDNDTALAGEFDCFKKTPLPKSLLISKTDSPLLGIWTGKWDDRRRTCHTLVVRSIEGGRARVIHSTSSSQGNRFTYETGVAQSDQIVLQFKRAGRTSTYRLDGDSLRARQSGGSHPYTARLQKVPEDQMD